MNKIKFICGQISSGKSTIASQEAAKEGATYVDISHIVKQLLNETAREKLQGHPELDEQIVDKLKLLQFQNNLIVCGARQISIINAFPDAEIAWVHAPRQQRLERYLNRKDEKDILTEDAFTKAEERDNELGLLEIYKFCMSDLKGKIINNITL